MKPTIEPFLMFEGTAEAAMNFYVSLFPNSKIADVKRYGKGEMGKEGSIMTARFVLDGQSYLCSDSPVKHAFTFTPSLSLFAHCKTETEIEKLYKALAEGGATLMPLAAYPFSRKFAWVNDRFGVSWQISLDLSL